MYLCNLVISTAQSSNFGACFLMKMSAANLAAIDLLQHKSISVPVQGLWDGVTLSSPELDPKYGYPTYSCVSKEIYCVICPLDNILWRSNAYPTYGSSLQVYYGCLVTVSGRLLF